MSFNSTKSTKKWTEDEIKERKRLAVRKVKAKRTDSVAKYQNFSLPDLDPDGGEAEEKNEEKREEERKMNKKMTMSRKIGERRRQKC